MDQKMALKHLWTDEFYELVYGQFVVENYYGGSSEPISREYFDERWEEMSEDVKAQLIERARRKGRN